MLEDRWSWKRFWMVVLILAATALTAFLALARGNHGTGERSLILLCSLMFAVFLVLYLEWNRIQQGIYQEKANNFKRIAYFYGAACALTVLTCYLPGELRPVILPPAMMTMALDPFTGLLCGGYFAALICLTLGEPVSALCAYLLIGMSGCVLAPYLQKKGHILWGCFMTFCATLGLLVTGSVLGEGSIWIRSFIWSLGSALLSCGGMALLFRLCNDKIEHSWEDTLKRIVRDDYELVETMRRYSRADYEHAWRVARIARGCALKIGADPGICEAAGLFYRIGRLEGKPYVRNGVALARKRGFPPEVIQILAEYNGEELLPSTLESALVHITDSVVAKFDILDKSTLSSSWNQDIIIYQTLNENSARGIYDRSGLGMNLFLLIRDYLIKEVPLYDSYHREQQ